MIDADALIDAIENSRGKNSIYAQFVRAWVKEAPTEDAVPVVRCRDCKFWSDTPSDILVRKCNVRSGYASDNGYCSYGERKDNE